MPYFNFAAKIEITLRKSTAQPYGRAVPFLIPYSRT